jgi:hypothetical protein
MNMAAWGGMDILVGGILAATFFMPPVLAGVGWKRWFRPAPARPLQVGIAMVGLVLNTIGAATTALTILAAILAASMGGGLTLSMMDWVSVVVISASVLSAICALCGTPQVRLVLLASSVLAAAFWPLLSRGVGIL